MVTVAPLELELKVQGDLTSAINFAVSFPSAASLATALKRKVAEPEPIASDADLVSVLILISLINGDVL